MRILTLLFLLTLSLPAINIFSQGTQGGLVAMEIDPERYGKTDGWASYNEKWSANDNDEDSWANAGANKLVAPGLTEVLVLAAIPLLMFVIIGLLILWSKRSQKTIEGVSYRRKLENDAVGVKPAPAGTPIRQVLNYVAEVEENSSKDRSLSSSKDQPLARVQASK